MSTSSAGLNETSWGLHWGWGGEGAMLGGVVGVKQKGSGTGDVSVRILWRQDP